MRGKLQTIWVGRDSENLVHSVSYFNLSIFLVGWKEKKMCFSEQGTLVSVFIY